MVVMVVEVVVMVIVVVMALIMAATLAELSEASSRRNNGMDLAAAMDVVVSGMLALRTSELSSSEMISMLSFETALGNREGVAGAVFRRERSSATIMGGNVLDSIE
jgi:archaellum biogenesis protein FlaJ (TadC family)